MRRLGTALLAALLLSLTITACGKEDDADGVATLDEDATDGGATDAADSEDDLEEQALAFAECMRENGVDMPDPEVDGDGNLMMRGGGAMGEVDPETVEQAMETCEDLRPERGGGFSAEDQAEMQDRVLAFAECMREHGIDMPDPEFDGGMVRMGPPEGVDPEDPEFVEAQEACQDEVGMDGPGARS